MMIQGFRFGSQVKI